MKNPYKLFVFAILSFFIISYTFSISNAYSQPTLSSPPSNSTNVSCETLLSWFHTSGTPSTWQLYVSTSSSFGNYDSYTGNYSGMIGSYRFNGGVLNGNTKYYWKVKTKFSNNNWSAWSSVWNFTTAQRYSTTLVSPWNNATNVNTPVLFSWMSVSGAHYHLFIRSTSGFSTEITVPSGGTSTYSWNNSSANTTYFWKVRPDKESEGFTTVEWAFTTRSTGIRNISTEIPPSYKLHDNYPNPFNPSTNIRYDIPENVIVKLVILDELGREIETLVNEKQSASTYEANWNAIQYSSGVYYYRLQAGDFISTKKLVLIK
jgi:hypothetical protein